MKPKFALRRFLAALGFATLTISSASAQATSGTWNTDAAGNWTDPLNWLGDTAYAEGTDNTATFGDFISADRTVNLDTNITIGNITASDTTHNYTISGANVLTLDRTTGVPIIDVTTGTRTLTITSRISGSDGLQKDGAGTLLLSNSTNDFSGGIVVNAGTLRISGTQGFTGGVILNGGSLGDTTTSMTAAALNNNSITVNGSAVFRAAGGSTFSSSSGITINSTGVLDMGLGSAGTVTYNGAVTGSGVLDTGSINNFGIIVFGQHRQHLLGRCAFSEHQWLIW